LFISSFIYRSSCSVAVGENQLSLSGSQIFS